MSLDYKTLATRTAQYARDYNVEYPQAARAVLDEYCKRNDLHFKNSEFEMHCSCVLSILGARGGYAKARTSLKKERARRQPSLFGPELLPIPKPRQRSLGRGVKFKRRAD
jgi:hypothetical protein